MKWNEYYEKISEWQTSTAVNRLSKLESFGPAEEIVEVFMDIAFYDEKGAVRLLRKAVDAGVYFSGEQLAEMWLIVPEPEMLHTVEQMADRFQTADLDALEGFAEGDFLCEIAKKYRIRLPAGLQEYYNDFLADESEEENWENVEAPMTKAELKEAYGYILECLSEAHEFTKMAFKLSLADMNSRKKAVSVSKYAYIAKAQPLISEAVSTLEEIESQAKEKVTVRNLRFGLTNMNMLADVFGDGFLANIFAQKRIKKVLKTIETTYKEVKRLWDSL